MKLSIRLVLLLAVSLSACRTVGVEIADEALQQSIGMTEEEVLELYGLPHSSSLDSNGVVQIEYGLEHWTLLSLDGVTRVEFTLVDGVVTQTKRSSSRRIADKNRAR